MIKLLILLFLAGCGDFTQNNLDGLTAAPQIEGLESDEIVENVLKNTTNLVVYPTLQNLERQVLSLNNSLIQTCHKISKEDELSQEQVSTLYSEAQNQWKETMTIFHQLEMMRVSPSLEKGSTLIDSIYTFDRDIKCRVDLALIRGTRGLPQFDMITNYNVRGLDSIETLLFHPSNKTRCQRENSRLTEWYKKPLKQREMIKCDFMLHLMTDIQAKSSKLTKTFQDEQKNSLKDLKKKSFNKKIESLAFISKALFYVDSEIKDLKILYPMGTEITLNGPKVKCPEKRCPNQREHQYSDYSFDSIEASYRGLYKIFFAISDINSENETGLDDILISRGHSEEANKFKTYIERAIKNIQDVKNKMSFGTLLKSYEKEKCTKNQHHLCLIVSDIKAITDFLKKDYMLIMNEFSLPPTVQGDND